MSPKRKTACATHVYQHQHHHLPTWEHRGGWGGGGGMFTLGGSGAPDTKTNVWWLLLPNTWRTCTESETRKCHVARQGGCQNPGETHILKKNVPIWTSFSESSKTSFPLAGAMNYDFSCWTSRPESPPHGCFWIHKVSGCSLRSWIGSGHVLKA